MCTGWKEPENHCILGLALSKTPNDLIVVDMSRMQYGEAGRGKYGETYYFGMLKDWCQSMSKICGKLEEQKRSSFMQELDDERWEVCARKVWKRWEKRDVEFWCEYCGKPTSEEIKCAQCKDKAVTYCCKEHLKSGWKLHLHTCERKY